jgi:hypothetical protein
MILTFTVSLVLLFGKLQTIPLIIPLAEYILILQTAEQTLQKKMVFKGKKISQLFSVNFWGQILPYQNPGLSSEEKAKNLGYCNEVLTKYLRIGTNYLNLFHYLKPMS